MEHSIFPHGGDTLHIEDIELRFDDTTPLMFTDYLFIAFPSSKSPKIGLYPVWGFPLPCPKIINVIRRGIRAFTGCPKIIKI